MGTPTDTSPDHAFALHRAGRLGEARAAYAQRLAANPTDVAARHGLGLIALDEGRPTEALPLLLQCVEADPGNAVFRVGLGLALLGIGDAGNAADHFLDAANRAPGLADARLHLARSLVLLKRHDDALKVLGQAAEAFPDRADLWALKGNVARTLDRPDEARASLRRALACRPERVLHADILNNLGVLARDAGALDEAAIWFREALTLAPRRALFHANLGSALAAQGKAADGEAALREGLALDPNSADASAGLGLLLTAQERAREAIPHLRRVLARNENDADALTNLGVALLAEGKSAEAEAAYRSAISLAPDNAEAHYNLAWLLLLMGRWREGWEQYEWRWKLKNFSSRRRGFRDVVWDGTPLSGTLLVHAEQGLGDTIQFARFIALAKARCGRVVLECAPKLAKVLATVAGADQVIAVGQPIPPFDRHIPLMSLPRVLGITPETIPAARGYLPAPAEIPAYLRLPATNRPRIGLVWAGSPDNKIDCRRSCVAALLRPLLDTDAAFVSLQVDARARELADLQRTAPAGKFILDCAGMGDFSETAAIVAQLDLVIGVDTAVMHLAGTMGRPVWMLLPFMPDFRWLLGRDDSPWYASMRLFRQAKPAGWEELISRVARALTAWQPAGG